MAPIRRAIGDAEAHVRREHPQFGLRVLDDALGQGFLASRALSVWTVDNRLYPCEIAPHSVLPVSASPTDAGLRR